MPLDDRYTAEGIRDRRRAVDPDLEARHLMNMLSRDSPKPAATDPEVVRLLDLL